MFGSVLGKLYFLILLQAEVPGLGVGDLGVGVSELVDGESSMPAAMRKSG